MDSGQQIAQYTVVEKIGAGGMGEVYRARDTRLGRDVAIKAIPERVAADPEYLARFDREAQTLAALNHPGIGAIYGLEELEGRRYLVLELVPGRDLADALAEGAMSVADTVGIGVQLAEALEAAHEAGIVHRDLKPANIKLTPQGLVKVLDFGLAKSAAPASGIQAPDSPTVPAPTPQPATTAGAVIGSSGYMSPEQARGLPVDKRSDIFAFGVVMMEMLTGERVFRGGTQSDVLAAVLREEPDFESLPPNAPLALRQLLRRCLHKDPRSRLRDIGDARIVLQDLAAGGGKMETSFLTIAARPAAPRRLALAGWVVAAVMTVVAATLLVRGGWDRDPVAPPVEKLPLAMPADDAERNNTYHATISPSGRFLAYVVDDRIHVRDFSRVDPVVLNETEGARSLFWSPDGEWIGYLTEQAIHKVPRAGGAPTLVYRLTEKALSGSAHGAWDADDTICFTTGTGGMQRVSSRGGDAVVVGELAEGETDFHAFTLLPGGRGCVMVVHDREKGFGNLDLLTPDGTRRRLVAHTESVEDPAYSPTGHVLYSQLGPNAGVWAFPFSLETLERTGEPFLVASGARRPRLSDDGTLVYGLGTRAAVAQLAVFDRAGDVVRRVGRPVRCTTPFPDLSPDGTRVAVVLAPEHGQEVFVYDLATGDMRPVTSNRWDEHYVEFTPDGRGLVFDIHPQVEIHFASLDGGRDGPAPAQGLIGSISPDGTLLFTRTDPDAWNWDLYARPLDGAPGEERVLVGGEGSQWTARVSPNGRYMAYASEESGRSEIYVTRFPGADGRWLVSSGGGEFPRWNGAGDELFYTTRETLWSAPVRTDGEFQAGVPRRLFDRPSLNWTASWSDAYAVSADGEKFYFMAPAEGADVPPRVVVARHWEREFE